MNNVNEFVEMSEKEMYENNGGEIKTVNGFLPPRFSLVPPDWGFIPPNWDFQGPILSQI